MSSLKTLSVIPLGFSLANFVWYFGMVIFDQIPTRLIANASLFVISLICASTMLIARIVTKSDQLNARWFRVLYVLAGVWTSCFVMLFRIVYTDVFNFESMTGFMAWMSFIIANLLYVLNLILRQSHIDENTRYEKSYFFSNNKITYILLFGFFTVLLLSAQSIVVPNLDPMNIWDILGVLVLALIMDVYMLKLYKVWITDLILTACMAVFPTAFAVLVNQILIVAYGDSRSPIFLAMAMAVVLCAWIFLRDNWYLIKIPKSKEEVATSN